MKLPPCVFWDFDGVIKESLEAKGNAFASLFSGSQDEDFLCLVRDHHYANGGVTRVKKIETYLSWLKKNVNPYEVDLLVQEFSRSVVQEVVKSRWVAGVEQYLKSNSNNHLFCLVSATPQNELEKIVEILNLSADFRVIVGAPTPKKEAVKKIMLDFGLHADDCLMIGDSCVDLEAANYNNIPFILRRHKYNHGEFSRYFGFSIEDFSGL